MLLKENIFINVDLKNKQAIFEFINQCMLQNQVVKTGYLTSIIARDQQASVALGNYLFLPHPLNDDQHLVIKSTIVFVSLKQTISINNQPIKFVIGLALKNHEQIDVITQIGLAFMDSEKVQKLVNDTNLTKEKIISFLE